MVDRLWEYKKFNGMLYILCLNIFIFKATHDEIMENTYI